MTEHDYVQRIHRTPSIVEYVRELGIFELYGRFTALSLYDSKTFKTRKGAEAWLARRGFNPDGSRV